MSCTCEQKEMEKIITSIGLKKKCKQLKKFYDQPIEGWEEGGKEDLD